MGCNSILGIPQVGEMDEPEEPVTPAQGARKGDAASEPKTAPEDTRGKPASGESPAPVSCRASEKACGTGCVSLVSPATGCGGPSCAPCSYAHAQAICTGNAANAACGMGTCEAGWADCNGNPADGCEQNLQTDPNNCGRCGDRCAPADPQHGFTAFSCVAGKCACTRNTDCGPSPDTCQDGRCACRGFLCAQGAWCNPYDECVD